MRLILAVLVMFAAGCEGSDAPPPDTTMPNPTPPTWQRAEQVDEMTDERRLSTSVQSISESNLPKPARLRLTRSCDAPGGTINVGVSWPVPAATIVANENAIFPELRFDEGDVLKLYFKSSADGRRFQAADPERVIAPMKQAGTLKLRTIAPRMDVHQTAVFDLQGVGSEIDYLNTGCGQR